MQRHTEAKALQRLPDRVMHRFHTGAGFARGFQHARTNLMNLVLLLRDRKNREQPVAHELQDFPAVISDGRHLAIEIAVENIHHSLSRQPVG